ncbi:MAG: HDOD domain-containing protein [Phycisphaerales bacterium]|nr:HDOD domain-containing protein [Phycisphaerales bacterium]
MSVAQTPDSKNQGGLPPELQKALARVNEISSLPEITTRIVEVVEDPKSTAQDMHEIVKNDPALATKILKVVNSAFYGLPSQIGSLDRAIVMLGLSAVKNIALAASLSRLFRPGSISERFSARDLWEHCIAVGVTSRLIADKALGNGQAEEAFVAGLVHDIGLLVEYQLFPDQLKQVADRCEQNPQDFLQAENEIIGADHQQFGAAIAAKWKFPTTLRYVIAYHHNPMKLKAEFRKIVAIVSISDIICCQNEIGFFLTSQSSDVTDELMAAAGTNEADIGSVMETLPERIEETKAIFSE